jgi:hypothetical protein
MSLRPVAGLAALAVGCMLTQSTATGQSFPPQQKGERGIDVSVQYSVRLPLKSREVDEQREVMEQGRKLLYHLAAGECTLLLAAIGSTCELARLNIQTHQPQPRSGDDGMTVSGNAQFKVGKPQN